MSRSTLNLLASNWARANAPIVEADLITSVEGATERGVNCTFAISRELTKAKTPRLLSFFAGEVFVFELTQRQAKSFNAVQGAMQFAEGGRCLACAADAPPLIDLEDLWFEHADGLTSDERIRGAVTYQKCDGFDFPGRVCLSLEYSLGNRCRTTGYYYPPAGLLPEGRLEFSFDPIDLPRQPPKGFIGPIVAHVRFLGTMNPKVAEGRVPLSNTCAALIEVI
ncbi:MAG TPA: hypothetical protein VF278_17595 [Pirellulales bacterium]